MTDMLWTRLGRTASGIVHRYVTAGSSGDLPVVRVMGQLVPLRPAAVPADAFDGVELLLAWVKSGDLTWQQAEALLALDKATPWEDAA